MAQREELLGLPAATQAFFHRRRLLPLDLLIAQCQQSHWLALALEDGAHDFEPADAGQIADDVVELHIHALQRLLHLLDLARRTDDVVGPQALVILQPPDVRRRHEAAAQQTVRVQRRQPLAVAHVRLAPRHVLHVPPVDHHHFQPGGFEHFVEIEPINAGGFHRYRVHALSFKPLTQGFQFAR